MVCLVVKLKVKAASSLGTIAMASKSFILQILAVIFIFSPLVHSIDFNFPAVFNFGDSNSDTGGLVAGIGDRLDPPNGQIFFKRPAGRFCDGRLIVDFLGMFQTISLQFMLCLSLVPCFPPLYSSVSPVSVVFIVLLLF